MQATRERLTREPQRRAAAAVRAEPTRRDLCRGLLWASGLPILTGALGGCAAGFGRFAGGEAALLLPLSGPAGALGQNMARAASLVAVPGAAEGPPVFDTQDTAEGARTAAEAALGGDARMLFGPLRADQTPAVLGAAGGAPVVTFSNDDRLADLGAFVMGVTPAQSVAAAFSYARAQGVRRISLVARPGPLADASTLAARRLAAAGGLTLTGTLLRDSGAPGLVAALRTVNGGATPDAVFLPDGGVDLAGFAAGLAGSGVQLLGGVQWGVGDVTGVPGLAGAWFASPPPAAFGSFLDTFAARFGEDAGVVAALGHDAALVAAELGGARRLNRAGLTREAGFAGVLGKFRFLEDGRCLRDLAILTVEGGDVVAIGEVAET